jgi:hypothetical protein
MDDISKSFRLNTANIGNRVNKAMIHMVGKVMELQRILVSWGEGRKLNKGDEHR